MTYFISLKKRVKKELLSVTRNFLLQNPHPFATLAAEELQKADCVVYLASQSKIQQAKR